MIRTSPIISNGGRGATIKVTKTFKKIQVLCICFNSASCIYNTLKTWEPYTDRFRILINGGFFSEFNQVEDTIAQLGLLKKPVIYYVEPFVNFSDCRNRLIEKSYDPEYTIIMIDDSYELRRWKYPDPNIADQAVRIQTGKHKYYSNRIFNYLAVYKNEIHEIVESDKSVISGIVVYDNITYESHKLRRFSRLEKQIDLLKNKEDPRSLYYTAAAYLNLYMSNLKSKDETLNAIFNRLLINDTNTEEYRATKEFLKLF